MSKYLINDKETAKLIKKNDPKARAREKAEKDELQNIYGYALVDGYKEKVANFRVEPPNLFRGRGDHPKTGTLKRRVNPEDIIINIGQVRNSGRGGRGGRGGEGNREEWAGSKQRDNDRERDCHGARRLLAGYLALTVPLSFFYFVPSAERFDSSTA